MSWYDGRIVRVTLECPQEGCTYTARRACTSEHSTPCEPGRCPKHQIPLVRRDGRRILGEE